MRHESKNTQPCGAKILKQTPSFTTIKRPPCHLDPWKQNQYRHGQCHEMVKNGIRRISHKSSPLYNFKTAISDGYS